jgi:hypothetical protein
LNYGFRSVTLFPRKSTLKIWSLARTTATRGTVNEPGSAATPHGDTLLRNLLEGENIGDAFFRDEFFIGATWINVGDPLYTPFFGARRWCRQHP